MPLAFASPPITVARAHELAGIFVVCYVGGLYFFKNARLNFTSQPKPPVADGQERERTQGERWRDDPAVIRARIVVVSVVSLLSCAMVFVVLWNITGGRSETLPDCIDSTIARLGFTPPNSLVEVLLPSAIAPALFLGPLYVSFLDHLFPLQKAWSVEYSVVPYVGTWVGWRNTFAGPITEEIVFRACVLAVYKLAGSSWTKMVFLSPLWFGIAHLHHAWDVYNRYGRTRKALKHAFINSLFQLAYTTIFGFHCSWLFVRTGSLVSPVLSHIFCNIMGFPLLPEEIKRHPNRKITIIIFYLLGIVAYCLTIVRWTVVKDNLYWQVDNAVARY